MTSEVSDLDPSGGVNVAVPGGQVAMDDIVIFQVVHTPAHLQHHFQKVPHAGKGKIIRVFVGFLWGFCGVFVGFLWGFCGFFGVLEVRGFIRKKEVLVIFRFLGFLCFRVFFSF